MAAAGARAPEHVRLLWEVCQVPGLPQRADRRAHAAARRASSATCAARRARLPEDWVAAQVRALDRTDGDLDALLARIAAIRTWTYVAHRDGWLRGRRALAGAHASRSRTGSRTRCTSG